MNAKSIEQQIHDILIATFAPSVLKITNESAQHHGHAGANGTKESHFHIEITAQAFCGVSRLAAQRLVYDALAQFMPYPVHALRLSVACAA